MSTFRIRTQRVRDFHVRQQEIETHRETYLGPAGVWSPAERAVRFRSLQAAERALLEEWNRLRNAGNKSVILSVVRARR